VGGGGWMMRERRRREEGDREEILTGGLIMNGREGEKEMRRGSDRGGRGGCGIRRERRRTTMEAYQTNL
jgi:hypothetical protein